MNAKRLFSQHDHDRIVAAIADAEKHTSGEIRVFVSHRKVRDVHRAAVHRFLKLGMNQTKGRNAVLIFVAPESRNFAILGDEAVHARCGQEFWDQVAGGMRELFQQSKLADGIVHGINAAGKSLAQHFPSLGANRNELPDSVIEK